jgi:hypothetical protein
MLKEVCCFKTWASALLFAFLFVRRTGGRVDGERGGKVGGKGGHKGPLVEFNLWWTGGRGGRRERELDARVKCFQFGGGRPTTDGWTREKVRGRVVFNFVEVGG